MKQSAIGHLGSAAKALTLTGAMVFVGASAAQAGRGGPCVEDARKYCQDISVMGGKLQECLKKNMNNLSESCKAQVGGVKTSANSAGAAVKDACAGELQAACKGVSPMEMPKCMKEKSGQLSDKCKGSVGGLKESLVPKY